MENIPDPDIDELKEIVKRQGVVIEETNKILHSMRRGQRWRTLWSVLWWLLILGTSGAAYYYYLAPYLSHILAIYQQAAQGGQQAQGEIQNLIHSISSWLPNATTTSK